MDQKTLTEYVAVGAGITIAAADKAIRVVVSSIAGDLEVGTSTRLPGLGTFSVKDRPASEGRNPRTGEKIQIAAQRLAKFSPAKALKEALNPAPALRRKRA